MTCSRSLDLALDKAAFAEHLCREIVAGGLTVVDVIEKCLGEWLEDSVLRSFGDSIVKAPRAQVHPMYYVNRFQNLAHLSRHGYSTWYPEVRFATAKDSPLEITYVATSGLQLGSISYGGETEPQYAHKQRQLKTQVNHTLRLNRPMIPADVFLETIHHVNTTSAIQQPIISNLTVGCQNFVDDRIEGFRTVAFDNAVTGERRFCRCNSDAHRRMLSEAKGRAASFATGSWPHHVIALLESVVYADGLCHFCVSERHGREAPTERYGPAIQKHYGPYIDLLVRTANMDLRTAKAETKHRLALSRWVREEELYGVVRRLFSNEIVRRETSPKWLGRQRLDIYLPRVGLAIEHQGEQHYRPIEGFGGDHAFALTRERDERKRALCEENSVAVVDMRFDEALTVDNVRRRLRRWL